MRISPHFIAKQWHSCFLPTEPDWNTAIQIVQDRIEGRWLAHTDRICGGKYSGFAVIVLDCIVLESLWGFRNGEAVPHRQEARVYREMLVGGWFGSTEQQADDFRECVRNGLMHDGETRKGWLVEKTVPKKLIVEQIPGGGYRLNRTKFHEAVKRTVKEWIEGLYADRKGFRENMRRRMDDIIQKST
jgi:hypothetical protein